MLPNPNSTRTIELKRFRTATPGSETSRPPQTSKGTGAGINTPAIENKPAAPTQVYPRMDQRLNNSNSWRSFEFPFPPVNVEHSNLSPEWVEVDRPGFVPIVGLNQYRLMRIQFDFLLAAPWDGIRYPVEDQLALLREIANGTNPVFLTGMGSFLQTPISLPGAISRKGMFFRITDFTISSLRRNTDQQVTAAQCSLQMQEDYELNITAVTMPAIQYPAILQPRVATSGTPPPDDLALTRLRCTALAALQRLCTLPTTYTNLTSSGGGGGPAFTIR